MYCKCAQYERKRGGLRFMKLYKGYIETKGKVPVEKYTDPKNLKTYEEIKDKSEFAGVLAQDTVLIDFDDEIHAKKAYELITKNEYKCKVIETRRGIHVLFKKDGFFQKAFTHKQLACGLIADIKLGSKNGIEILKLEGVERKVIYDTEEYETPPAFFRPLSTDEKLDFLGMEEGDGRNDKLFRYILQLVKIMTKEDAKEVVNYINSELFENPLSEKEIEVITRDESFKKAKPAFFSEEGKFYFHIFAKWLMSDKKIIKIDGKIHIYKDGIYVDGSDWVERAMIQEIPGLNRTKRKEVWEYINLIVEEDKQTSLYSQYIAFRNGIYDVVSQTLLPFSPDYIITNKIEWDYNPGAYSKVVDDILTKISCADPKIRAILEEMIGYTFYRRNELGKAFILVGPQSNGKSTLQSMIQQLLGSENISSLDLSDLGERFKTAELYGKLANIGDDIGDKYIDDNNMFKTVVTGGRVIAEKKGQDPFEFKPYTKCVFSANNIPKTRDKTGAVKRRLIIVPFDRVFSPKDADYDPYAGYKVLNGTPECSVDENMSYMINLGLVGLHRVLMNNAFTTSEKVTEKLEEYDKDCNPIKLWYDEIGGVSAIDMEPTSDVYANYIDFTLSNNIKPMSKIEFSRTIKADLGIVSKPTTVGGKSIRIYVKGE